MSKKDLPIMQKLRRFLARPTPSKMLAFGLLALILVGTSLLCLPISTRSGNGAAFLDALFTATSAVCVTGLVVADTNVYWSIFGQTIILLLIQIGALGIMSVVTLYVVFSGRSASLTQRLAMKDSLNHYSLVNIVNIFLRILIVTLVVEGIGTVLIAIVLVPEFGWSGGLWRSVFHSISAFCNAGFDLFGTPANPYASLSNYQNNGFLLIITCVLIITGGLGFMVWQDIAEKRKFTKFSLHTKIVLSMTVTLLLIGTIGFILFEHGRDAHGVTWPYRLINAFFDSVTARTAGFNTTPMNKMSDSSSLLTLVLMFIGAAPGSTAGGIKVTTIYVLIAAVRSFMRGRSDVHGFKWRISMDIVVKSLSILLLGASIIILATLVLMNNSAGNLRQALFETTSAFGTVGLSMGITPTLPAVSKFILIIVMYLGRTGPITAVMAFSVIQENVKMNYRFPEGKIMVG